MPAPKFIVEYLDGNTDTVKLLPRAQMQYERETGKSLMDDDPNIEDIYRIAWYASGTPDDFEAWIDRIETVSADLEGTELDSERPTSPAMSSD